MPQTIGLYMPEELEDFEQNHELYRQLKNNPNKQLLKSMELDTTSCDPPGDRTKCNGV